MTINSSGKIIGVSFFMLVSTVACTQQGFKLINPKEKRAFLSKNWVFNDKVRLAAADSTGQIAASPSGESNNSGTTGSLAGENSGSSPNSGEVSEGDYRPGSEDSNEEGGEVSSSSASMPATIAPSVGIQYICGNRLTTTAGGINLLHSEKYGSFTVRLVDVSNNKVLCERSGSNIKEALLDQKKLLLPTNCPDLSSAKFDLQLFAGAAPALAPKDSGNSRDELLGAFFGAMGVTEVQQGQLLYNQREMPISGITSNLLQNATVSQSADKLGKPADLSGLFNIMNAAGQNGQFYVLYDERDSKEACDLRSASPLFINMGRNGHQTELTPISEGVTFDILGKNAKPVAHEKKRISWFVDPNYMFIVKPNRSGQVLGVDEMFGNNTQGPDGKMADDGFHALAKYDANRDSIIDGDDEIFKQLRLWSDSNLDGIAEPGELFYLDFMGVEAIDLRYNPDYYELDKYGNEIKYKSVVKMKDQSFKLVFDLWFRYL